VEKLVSILVIAILIEGCAMPAEFAYPPDSEPLKRISEKPKVRLSVAVMPFKDTRGQRNSMKTFWICFLPLAPYGFFVHERPDTARFFNTISEFSFDASRDMAKAVVESLSESGLFDRVYFSPEEEGGSADLVMYGEVSRTLYRGRTFTYCLSLAATALWLVGLPIGDSMDALNFSLELRDSGTGESIWQYQSRVSKRITQGFYYGWGDDVKGYSELMAGAMNEALGGLGQTMAAYCVHPNGSEEVVGTGDRVP
jgi:hypothetical protein